MAKQPKQPKPVQYRKQTPKQASMGIFVPKRISRRSGAAPIRSRRSK